MLMVRPNGVYGLGRRVEGTAWLQMRREIWGGGGQLCLSERTMAGIVCMFPASQKHAHNTRHFLYEPWVLYEPGAAMQCPSWLGMSCVLGCGGDASPTLGHTWPQFACRCGGWRWETSAMMPHLASSPAQILLNV